MSWAKTIDEALRSSKGVSLLMCSIRPEPGAARELLLDHLQGDGTDDRASAHDVGHGALVRHNRECLRLAAQH
jgi:hypothetical protein